MLMETLTLHKGASKALTFTTTGSFLGKDVEFRIGKRISEREIDAAITVSLVVSGGGTSASGDAIAGSLVTSGAGYESQLVIINSADEDDFEVVDGPPVRIKETI